MAAEARAEYSEVHVSCGSAGEAATIGRTLVEERLVACAQTIPITSVYWWDGEIESGEEVLLVLKTTAQHISAITTRVTELHSYDLPAITWSPGCASPHTAAWIAASTS